MVILSNPLITPAIGLVFWTSITFLILLILLRKFAWKPILGAVKERETKIEDALASAEKAKEEMQNLNAENEKLLKEARAERDVIIKQAQDNAAAIVNEAKTKAGEESAKMLEKAQATIQSEKRAAVNEIRSEAAQLSVEIAEKLLQRELKDKQAQEELLKEFVQEIEVS